MPAPRVTHSAGDDQVHGLRAFALFVRFDIETDLLAFVQAFESGLFHGRDVHEHIAPAIIRLYKAVASLAVEELHNTRLRHRENSSPHTAPPREPHARRLGRTFTYGESVGLNRPQSLRRPPIRRRNVTANDGTTHQVGSAGKGHRGTGGRLALAGKPCLLYTS